jgi:signal transduction histidine kinase
VWIALAAKGITPLPEAPRATLLRRVYVDLIGLPPTRAELQASLSDASRDAYERVVNRLLNDPRHGERWARHWMDVWRYSDWYGRRRAASVAVSDTGCGIVSEYLPRIFDRSYRADQSRNRRTGGAGLGLSIRKAIAEAHGGMIDVVSAEGKGSTFTLRIPLA